MPDETTGASDGLDIVAPTFYHRHIADTLNNAGAFLKPHEVSGHTWEEALKLHTTLNEHGKPIVSAESLKHGFTPYVHPIVLEVRNKYGQLKQLIWDHNCRTNKGGTWQSILMGGDTNANLGYNNSSGAVTYTGTTVTPTASPTWTVNQWAGHVVVAPKTTGTTPILTYAVVLSNTATALTVDQWTTIGSATGAVDTTPAANASFSILAGQSPAMWIGLSTDTTTEDIGDTTMAGEFTGNFATTGRWRATYTQTTTPSGTGTTNSNSIITLATGVLTANGTVTVAKAGLFNAQNGGILAFERKFGTAASLISGDTLATTWTETLS